MYDDIIVSFFFEVRSGDVVHMICDEAVFVELGLSVLFMTTWAVLVLLTVVAEEYKGI